MKKLFLLFVFITGLLTASYAQRPHNTPAKPPARVQWGTVTDGTFTSTPLGMKMILPDDFIVIPSEESEILSGAGTDVLKQGGSSGRAIDAAVNRTIRLLAIAEKPVGTPENSVLEMATVKQPAGVTAKMSLAANLALLRGSPLTLNRSLGSLKLGRNTFEAADLDGRVSTITFKQRMYVVMHRGYSILIAVTYDNEDQLAALEDVLATMTLAR